MQQETRRIGAFPLRVFLTATARATGEYTRRERVFRAVAVSRQGHETCHAQRQPRPGQGSALAVAFRWKFHFPGTFRYFRVENVDVTFLIFTFNIHEFRLFYSRSRPDMRLNGECLPQTDGTAALRLLRCTSAI